MGVSWGTVAKCEAKIDIGNRTENRQPEVIVSKEVAVRASGQPKPKKYAQRVSIK